MYGPYLRLNITVHDDWRAVVSQWAVSLVTGALLTVSVGVVGRRRQ